MYSNETNITNFAALRQHIIAKEGYSDTSYIEEISKKYHIGFGHLLEQEQTDEELQILGLEDDLENWEDFTITKEQAEALLDYDIQEAINTLLPTFTEEDLEKLTVPRYIALISMSFQLGGYGVQRFTSMCKAIHEEDWDRAADEMLWRDGLKKHRPSKWFTETKSRCEQAAHAMRYSTFEEVDTPDEKILTYKGDSAFPEEDVPEEYSKVIDTLISTMKEMNKKLDEINTLLIQIRYETTGDRKKSGKIRK